MDPKGMGMLQWQCFDREHARHIYLHASRRFKHPIGNIKIYNSYDIPRKGWQPLHLMVHMFASKNKVEQLLIFDSYP